MTDAPPFSETAPSWRMSAPVCSAMMAPNGIEVSVVGRIETLATNQHCWMNSRHWNGALNTARRVSSDMAAKLPVSRRKALPAFATQVPPLDISRRLGLWKWRLPHGTTSRRGK